MNIGWGRDYSSEITERLTRAVAEQKLTGPADHVQVFVDDSGRRRRWTRAAGAGITAVCVVYTGIVVVGLSQTAVGPLQEVPAGGNGRIAGFPNSDGSVPGLLQDGTAKPGPRSARVPVTVHAARTTAPRTPAPPSTSKSPTPTPTPTAKHGSGADPTPTSKPPKSGADKATTTRKASSGSSGSA